MSAGTRRFHGLDALRAFAMLLGIVIHAALPYHPGIPPEFWPSDANSSATIGLISTFIHSWRMPIFFILSGFFANLFIIRKSWKSWWLNRFLRLVLPAIVFFPFFSLSLPWIFKYGHTGVLEFFYSNEGQPFHFWFLHHLIIFVFVSVILRCFGLVSSRFLHLIRFAIITKVYGTLLGWLGKIGFESRFPIIMIFVMGLANLFTGAELVVNPIASSLYFIFGYRLYKNTKLFTFITTYWRYYFISGVVVLMILYRMEAHISGFSEEDVRWTPYVLVKVANAVLFSCAFIGLAQKHFSHYNPMLRLCSDATYWIYVIHLPIVTFITFYLFTFDVFVQIKFFIAITLTSLICLLTYKYLVRSTIIGKLLNGKTHPFRPNIITY